MSLPIRAFLMIKVGWEDWAVDVCRDFDAVVAAWQRRSDISHSAILHIGFDRPPSAAFDQIATDFPGRMLFTAAAKYGVPGQFEASDMPVGFVDGLPVHLALRGWGYTEDGVFAAATPKSEIARQRDWADWLISFTETRPEFVEELEKAGVFSETDYLSNEANLPREIRYSAGLYRFDHLIKGEENDPCAAVRSAPPWLLSRKLEDIPLTVRLRNVFAYAGFETIADIGSITLNDLYHMRNFGKLSHADLIQILIDTMEEGPRDEDMSVSTGAIGGGGGAANSSLLAELHRTMARCEPRERDILLRRMGLGCTPETLISVGKDYNITRERVRQIEAKSTKRILRQESWDDVLVAKLGRVLANRDYPLPIMGLEAVDPWFVGIAEEASAFSYLVENFCGGRVSITTIDGIDYIGYLKDENWQSALAEGKKILNYASGKNWDEMHVQALLAPALPERAREFRGLLWENLSKRCQFSTGSDGVRTFISFGQAAENLVEAILAEAETPLHYSEIAIRLESRFGRQFDIRRVHKAAGTVGILVGRGIFGSEKHLGVEPADLEKLSEAASDIILDGPEAKQWHSAELLGDLIDLGFSSEYLNKYVLDYALRKSRNLNRLGRMTWSARDHGSIAERIDIHDAVQSLIFDAGRPLTTIEIRQRLKALRGTNNTSNFSFTDPIIRIGFGLWGLNDRDVPLAREHQPALVEHLISKLSQNGRGIHVSELLSELDPLWRELPPQIILSIGNLDERLQVSAGQFLYLSEWKEPRRESVVQIVRRLVTEGPEIFTSAQVIRQIERECTLEIDTSQVSAAIRSAGATFDSDLRLWSIHRQPEEHTLEEDGDADLIE